MEGASGRTVHATLRGARCTRRSFGHAMAMVAGRRASPRAQAPRRDDERCRASSARRLSDDRFVGETGNTASEWVTPAEGVPSRGHLEPLAIVDSQWSRPGSISGRARMMGNGFVLACSVDDRSEPSVFGSMFQSQKCLWENTRMAPRNTLSVRQGKRVNRGFPALAPRISLRG
jgi:hypothetical protein